MKKLLTALLLIVMLCQVLPFDALAAVGKVLTDEELDRAYALTGLGESSGLYHNGMKPNLSWNAMQLSDYLDAKLSADVRNLGEVLSRAANAVAELKERDPEAYRRFVEYGDAETKLQQLYVEAEALREEMRYYQKHIDEAATLIAEMKDALENQSDALFDSGKVRKSARIEEAAANLVADRQYVVDNIDAWEEKIDRLERYLQTGPAGEDETQPFVGDYISSLFTGSAIVENAAAVNTVSPSASRMSRLAAGAGAAANDPGVDASIYVVTDQDLVFALAKSEDGKKTPVDGVEIKIKDINNPNAQEMTYYSGATEDTKGKGLLVLPTNQFVADEFDAYHLQFTMNGERSGYQSMTIDDLDMEQGEIYNIAMVPLSASYDTLKGNAAGQSAANADSGPYLVSAMLGSKDILHTDYQMIFSTVNEHEFTIKVEVAHADGYPELVMNYYSNTRGEGYQNLVRHTVEATTHDGNVYTFTGKWKQEFTPNANEDQRPSFSFGTDKDAVTFSSRLVSVRAATEQPINEGTGATGVFNNVQALQGIGFGLDIPFLKDLNFHMGLNIPITNYIPKININASGNITAWIGNSVLSDKMKDKLNKDIADMKEYNRQQKSIENKTGVAKYEAQKDMAYDYYKSGGWKFMGQANIDIGLFAVASGRWEIDNDDPDVLTKLVTTTLGFGATATFSFSWTISYPLGPVPVYLCFTASLAVGFGINSEMRFCFIDGSVEHWDIRPMRELDISIAVIVALQLGAGIKGFLDFYVKAAYSLNIMVRLYIVEKEHENPNGFSVSHSANVTVGVNVFFVPISVTYTFLKQQLYPNASNLLQHYMNADTEAPEKPASQEPYDYPALEVEAKQVYAAQSDAPLKQKLMTIEGDTYLFFIGRESSGDARLHWKNLRTGKEQSAQEAFDAYMQYDSYQGVGNMSGVSDIGFDVWYGDGLLIIVRCFTPLFDENGYPTTSDADMLILERQSDGSFQAIFKNTKMATVSESNAIENRTFLAHGEFWKGVATMSDPIIDDARLVWSDKASRKLSGVRMSGTMSRVVPQDQKGEGVVFFVYNNTRSWEERQGPRKLILHSDQYMGRHSGYVREQFLSPVRMQDYYDRYFDAGVYGFEEGAQDFIALNRSETDSADAFIEFYDMHLNGARDDRGGYRNPGVMKGIRLVEGDIRHMALLPDGGDGVTRLLYTMAEKNTDGVGQLRAHGLELQPTQEGEFGEFDVDVTRYDYDLVIPVERFQVGYIGLTPYLYWWSAVPKDGDASKLVWRVWAAAYDPASQTMAAPGVFAQFELPKVRIQTGKRKVEEFVYDAIKTNGRTTIEVPVYEDVDFVPTGIELTASGTGYLVAVRDKLAVGEKQPQWRVYTFPEILKPVASLTAAIPQALAVKAGDFEDINIGIMNEGNVALATVDVELREVDGSGSEGPVVETVHVNLHEPAKSKVTMADGKVKLSGKQVAHRVEDYDYSPRQRDFVLSQVTTNHSVNYNFGVTDTTREISRPAPKHLASDMLMPGSLADVMAAFKIPDGWAGNKNLRLRVNGVTIESNALRAAANAGGLVSNTVGDGNDSVELVYRLNRDSGKLELQRPAVANSAVSNAIASGLYANEVEAGDAVDIMVEVHDIDVSHRVYTGWDGRDWLDIIVYNHAATGDALKLVCAVYVDGSDEPAYVNLPYYPQATSARRTQTITLPVSALVDDPAKHKRARVEITAVGTDERAWSNNEFTVYLGGNDALRFVKQPDDATVQEGENASFSVEVAGGVKPYSYQWQVYNPKTGQWMDLKGFTDPTMSREKVEAKWDGCRFRCVVTDAAGTQIISREVTLTIRGAVDTGDHSNLPLYLAAALMALVLLMLLRRRVKRT